jgi:hypothetical protein
MKFFSLTAKIYFLILMFFGLATAYTSVQAHPGRTDSSGCHTCRTNCSSWGLSSGEYHCHKAKTVAPQPEEPIKSVYGEGGTGYTKSAPEYKTPLDNTGSIANTNVTGSNSAETSKIEPMRFTNYSKALEEEKRKEENMPNIVEGTNNIDSSLGALILLALIGGTGYLIGKKKSSNKK